MSSEGHTDRLDNMHIEAVDPPGRLEHLDIAHTVLAEAEVVPLNHRNRMKAVNDDIADELLGRDLEELPAALHQHDAAGPGLGDQPEFLMQGRERRRHAIGRENGRRMRFEGHHHEPGAGGLSHLQALVQQGAMAAMDTVEVADGQYNP